MDLVSKQPKRVEVYAKITRKDGTVEELGMVSFWHKNPLVRLWYRLIKGIKGRVTTGE